MSAILSRPQCVNRYPRQQSYSRKFIKATLSCGMSFLPPLFPHSIHDAIHFVPGLCWGNAYRTEIRLLWIHFRMDSRITFWINVITVITHVNNNQLWVDTISHQFMITLSNGNISRVTGPLCGESTGHRWFTLKKASDRALRRITVLLLLHCLKVFVFS